MSTRNTWMKSDHEMVLVVSRVEDFRVTWSTKVPSRFKVVA